MLSEERGGGDDFERRSLAHAVSPSAEARAQFTNCSRALPTAFISAW